MFLSIPNFLSKSVWIDRDSAIRPIVRKAVALSKSAGPVCYLVSIGAVAIWVAGVFFGVGFYFLTHNNSAGPLSGIASDHLSESLPETPRVSQSMISLDRLFVSPPKVGFGDVDVAVAPRDEESRGDEDRQAVARAGLVPGQSSAELGRPLSADLGTIPRELGELAQVPPPPTRRWDGKEPQSVAPTLRSASPGKPQRSRLTNPRPAWVVRDTTRSRTPHPTRTLRGHWAPPAV
jgi:hypothetical protein